MGIKDFKPKWAHGRCRGKPVYVSSSKLLIPFDSFIMTCDVSGKHLRHHIEPVVRIGCCCSLPELGIIAVSERKIRGSIFVLSYPEMSKVSVLKQTNEEEYSALEFMGLEFLLSLRINNCYSIDLWKWSTAEKMHCTLEPLSDLETQNFNLLPNPLWWNQAFVRGRARLILLEVKNADDSYKLDVISYLFLEDKNGKIELSSSSKNGDENDFQTNIINPLLKTLTIHCFCWLPENNVLIATSGGILKVEYETFLVEKLIEGKTGILSMAFCKSRLFVGYKTGFIDIVTIVGDHWNCIETIKVGHPVNHLVMSPDYDFLTIQTLKGSIFLLQVSGDSNLNAFLRTDIGIEVGSSFIGPFGQHCVSVKDNGTLHIFRSFDGSILSTFQVDDEITSMASSPLCCCLVIGSRIGFLYFIEATNPHKPRIIHCERPFEMQVTHLKFDNFGRFLVASTKNRVIKIWSGLPSNNFEFLGCKNISAPVEDLTFFSRNVSGETHLFLLTACKSVSEKKSGNVLVNLTLPSDFGSHPQKYQIDVFGTLSEDTLSLQNRKLDSVSCKMDVHCTLGAILYSPASHKIQRCQIWSDLPCIHEHDLLSIKNVSYICISPDQQWFGITDYYGQVYLFTSRELVSSAVSVHFNESENSDESFLDFPLFLNNLIYSRENGLISFYEWTNDSSCLQTLPEWVQYCCSEFNRQNICLQAMEEEETINLISPDIEMNYGSTVLLYETARELEIWICVINFKLDKMLYESNIKNELAPSGFILREDSIDELASENRKKILLFVYEGVKKEKEMESRKLNNAVKVLSSISLGFVTQNFSERNIIRDVNLAQSLDSFSECKDTNSLHNTNSNTFDKSVKLRFKEERLTAMSTLIKQICDLKTKFNEEFAELFEKKANVTESLNEAYFEAKRLTQTLPSKAERDFWNASVVERDCGRFSEEEMVSERVSDEESETDAVQQAKISIESFAKSSRIIQERFDSNVQLLLLKKRYSDYNIFRDEVKIQSMLLFGLVEDEFAKWKEETEKETNNLKEFQSEIEELLKELLEVEENVKEIYLELQTLERNLAFKIESKCNPTVKRREEFLLLKKQPTLQLDNCSENPFWGSNFSPNIKDMALISKEFLSKNPCPDKIDSSDWECICNKRIRILKIGIVMRNIQNQALVITSTKHKCADVTRKLGINLNTIQHALENMSILMSKFSVNFYSFVTSEIDNANLAHKDDVNCETSTPTLSSRPEFDYHYWKDIDTDAYRIQGINERLCEVENLLKKLFKLKSEMHMKCRSINIEYPNFVKHVKEKLEEMRQNYSETKSQAEILLDGQRKSVFKVLKSFVF